MLGGPEMEPDALEGYNRFRKYSGSSGRVSRDAELSSLRSALAEKTAQVEAHKYALGQVTIQRDEARAKVERLREALEDLVDMCETEFTFGGPPVCDFDLMVLPSAREALAATAPDVDNKEVQ